MDMLKAHHRSPQSTPTRFVAVVIMNTHTPSHLMLNFPLFLTYFLRQLSHRKADYAHQTPCSAAQPAEAVVSGTIKKLKHSHRTVT